MRKSIITRFIASIPRRRESGVSLVEVIMVLGISSMLIGGAMAWFDSKKSTDFYDHMRQVESRVREVQSENVSSIVPGFTENSDCKPKVLATCPIAPGEEVYGTAVSMTVPAANVGSPQMRIWYLKRGVALVGVPPQAEDIIPYNTRDITFPADLRFEGYKIFRPTNGNLTCNATNYNSYRNLPFLANSLEADSLKVSTTNSESLVVFRKVTGTYNAFWSAAAIGFSDGTPGSKPEWDGNSGNPGWRGSYDDPNYIYSIPSASTARLQSQPCAVLWRFGSLERKAGAPTEPRFTAEINFNLVDGTTTLVTR
jgi:hypothetical protein